MELTRPVEDGGAPGLPHKPLGKIAVAVGPSDSSRIYALIETGDGVPWEHGETDTGELWRSDDGGDAWMLVSYNRNLAGRTAYYSRVVVSPDDADEAYFVAGAFSKTSDGGETATNMTYVGERPLGDNHDTWIDPTDGDRMIVGNDGGLAITVNRGRTWRRVHLPNAQMYHVAVDNRIPYYVYGNRQDGPSVRGPEQQPAATRPRDGVPRHPQVDVALGGWRRERIRGARPRWTPTSSGPPPAALAPSVGSWSASTSEPASFAGWRSGRRLPEAGRQRSSCTASTGPSPS